MLVCLSLADLVTASGNLVGTFFSRDNRLTCTIQSAFTSTSSICSFLWTVSIGLHLYLSMLRSTKKRNFQHIYHIVSWGLPLVILVIALSFEALGEDEFSRAVGWCWISGDVEYPLFWSFLVGKGEEISSYILTFILYALTLHRLHRRMERGLLPSDKARKVINQVDRKLMLVPLVFIMVRMWGTVRFLLVSADLIRIDLYWIVVFQGVGDSAQGFANFLLFCVFTKKVRGKYTRILHQTFCKKDTVLEDFEEAEVKNSSIQDETEPYPFVPQQRSVHNESNPLSSIEIP